MINGSMGKSTLNACTVEMVAGAIGGGSRVEEEEAVAGGRRRK